MDINVFKSHVLDTKILKIFFVESKIFKSVQVTWEAHFHFQG